MASTPSSVSSSSRRAVSDADALDVAGRGHADLGGEAAGEVALAHQRDAGERGDRAVGVGVLGDVVLRGADAVVLRRPAPGAGR